MEPLSVLEVLMWILALALVGVGVAGLVLPALPGAPVLFLGLVVAAWADGFTVVGTGTLILLGVMAALTYLVDFLASSFGAQRFGASKRSIVGAAVGAVVGIFFGLPGLLFGPFVGAMIGELTARRDLRAAGRAGLGATLGLAFGTAAKIALGLSMIGIFVFVRFI